MAGIGFELRRMIDQRGGFLSKVRAYFAAGLISSGPWLMTILTLTLLNLLAPKVGVTGNIEMFRALVTYAFAFSLVLVGAGQMAITRRVADLLYSKRYNRVLPAFTASMLVTGITAFVIAATFCAIARFSPALSFVAVSLFMVISMTWLALTWLSVAREYDMVLRAYVYGTLVSVVGVLFCLMTEGTIGVLAAYTAGQAFTLMLLTSTIVRGMESDGKRDFTVFRALRNFPRLVGVGLFYNAAIWVDKMIFWFRDGVGPHELVQYHPLYDTCCFLAYLTVVPALAVNLIRLETSFYETYREYYGAILAGTPLSFIEEKRNRMFETLQESTIRLLRVQGAISVLLIIFAPYLIEFLELPAIAVRVFRLACLGAFFHVMLLLTILMQMYFDLRAQAMGTSLVFLLLNAGLAWWSIESGVETYGIGYCAASFLALLLGYSLLHRSLERLDYLTFTGQPIDDGEIPLDFSEENAAEKKRSAEAAEGEVEDDDVEAEETPFEDQEEESEELVPAPAIGLPVFDPVLFPVPLREVERIAARQEEKSPVTYVELIPDPFLGGIDETEIDEFVEELEAAEPPPIDEQMIWVGPEPVADDETRTRLFDPDDETDPDPFDVEEPAVDDTRTRFFEPAPETDDAPDRVDEHATRTEFYEEFLGDESPTATELGAIVDADERIDYEPDTKTQLGEVPVETDTKLKPEVEDVEDQTSTDVE
ncbi:MAG: exopolysaccharide Pel transporter PelG [Planctomycetota bacterium]|jgi:uncharacterized membrane protein